MVWFTEEILGLVRKRDWGSGVMAISLSNLDLSWLKEPAMVERGRYRVDASTGELVTSREWHKRNPNVHGRKRGTVACPSYMPDVDVAYGGAWKSIIDDTPISSRTNWREHNKRNDVVCVDKDYWGHTETDHVAEIEARMEFDPSLVGSSEAFSWKDSE
jgi:hypothetical protein